MKRNIKFCCFFLNLFQINCLIYLSFPYVNLILQYLESFSVFQYSDPMTMGRQPSNQAMFGLLFDVCSLVMLQKLVFS